jgi:uncharacterized protein
VIEPSKVKEAFNRIEAENCAFRTYLKNHADEDELDEQFLKLHKELFLSYDCTKCRNCCKEYSASFKVNELDLVSAFLKMTEKDFTAKYIEEEFGSYQLNVKPCCFLKEDGTCEIETCKPDSCRDYPYTDKPERLFSLLSILESTRVCPVVFEMFERLKHQYGFKRRK